MNPSRAESASSAARSTTAAPPVCRATPRSIRSSTRNSCFRTRRRTSACPFASRTTCPMRTTSPKASRRSWDSRVSAPGATSSSTRWGPGSSATTPIAPRPPNCGMPAASSPTRGTVVSAPTCAPSSALTAACRSTASRSTSHRNWTCSPAHRRSAARPSRSPTLPRIRSPRARARRSGSCSPVRSPAVFTRSTPTAADPEAASDKAPSGSSRCRSRRAGRSRSSCSSTTRMRCPSCTTWRSRTTPATRRQSPRRKHSRRSIPPCRTTSSPSCVHR